MSVVSYAEEDVLDGVGTCTGGAIVRAMSVSNGGNGQRAGEVGDRAGDGAGLGSTRGRGNG